MFRVKLQADPQVLSKYLPPGQDRRARAGLSFVPIPKFPGRDELAVRLPQ